MFPENDTQFEDSTITKVDGDREHGWGITKQDGWGIGVPKDAPFAPEVGMTIRLYGKGIGAAVRGMFINGAKVFYRTEAEDEDYREIELYGADASDWLKRWDSGRSVWTIEMGGLGPGYEQCIHITCAEILRVMLDRNFDHARWSDRDAWKVDREDIDKAVMALPLIDKLGLSGAQWGAAISVASHLYMHGPRSVMNDDRVKDRKIQVSRTFPG